MKKLCNILFICLILTLLFGCGAEKNSGGPLSDGDYFSAVTLEGGTGRAAVSSPAAVTVKDGAATATVIWSSSNYDYMIVDGQKYLPVTIEGGSTFQIPVSAFGTALEVVADTVAMSTPKEITYTLTFASPEAR